MIKFNLILAVFVGIAAARAFAQEAESRRAVEQAVRREQILRGMPVNSDSRCVGLCLVAAALLRGDAIKNDGFDLPAQLGRRIYEAASRKERVLFHATLRLEEFAAPIESREALDALATAVVDCYKARYLDLIATPAGIEKLRASERDVLQNIAELDAVLDGDPDQLVPLFVTGSRIFPDGSVQGSNHAILMVKTNAEARWIYDPNDPGTPSICRHESGMNGLTIVWSCRYKNTPLIANHRYRIVRPESFWRALEK
jgi:hypothetical protein